MGKYLNMIRQVEKTHEQTSQHKVPVQGQIYFDNALPLSPGNWITWQGPDSEQRGPAVVDFLYSDPAGTVWVFVSLLDGWAAVNANYVTKTEEGPVKT